MTKDKQYMKQLKAIDTRHNFIVLRALYSEDYETEMHRAMIVENLQHVHENQIPTEKCGLLTLQTKTYNHAKTVVAGCL